MPPIVMPTTPPATNAYDELITVQRVANRKNILVTCYEPQLRSRFVRAKKSETYEFGRLYEQIAENINECINQLARLQDGWNGEDSLAPLPQTIERLQNLVDSLPRFALRLIQDPSHDIYADSDGDLLLEWALADGQIVAGIITQPEGWSGYFDNRNDESTVVGLSANLDAIVRAFLPTLNDLDRFGDMYYCQAPVS